jgi:hypothetical protein
MTTIIDGSGSAEFHTALPVAEGGTGATASTGSGNVVLSASPTLTGTIGAAALTLTTPLPVASGGTGTTSLSPKVGLITRDQTGTNGAVAYTGVGFQPSAVHFVATINNQTGRSVGFDDGTLHYVSAEATNGTNRYMTNRSIILLDNASWEQGASITALGSDGFTLTWVKGGSPPSGTMQIFYTAFR